MKNTIQKQWCLKTKFADTLDRLMNISKLNLKLSDQQKQSKYEKGSVESKILRILVLKYLKVSRKMLYVMKFLLIHNLGIRG